MLDLINVHHEQIGNYTWGKWDRDMAISIGMRYGQIELAFRLEDCQITDRYAFGKGACDEHWLPLEAS